MDSLNNLELTLNFMIKYKAICNFFTLICKGIDLKLF